MDLKCSIVRAVVMATSVLALTGGILDVHAVEVVRTQATTTRMTVATDRLPSSIRIFTGPGAEVRIGGYLDEVLREASVKVDVHPVDELAKAEAAINASLPRDMADAERLMKQRIADGLALDQEVQRGWLSVLMVRQFQIQRVPAIVFDDRQVVYGEHDLASALRHYQNHAEQGQ